MTHHSFLTIGHRGASGHEPENTLRSIRRALEMGADGIEIDIRLSKDGVPVVIHDSSLHRTTGASGLVESRTVAELRCLDAGKGEAIPTLGEVLDALRGGTLLNVELKGFGTEVAVLAELRAAVRQGRWRYDRLLVSSFDRKKLAYLADREPRLPLGLLVGPGPVRLASAIARIRPKTLHLPLRRATLRQVARAHFHGLRVFVYTVNQPASIFRLRKMGVAGVFTDYPELRSVISEERGKKVDDALFDGIEAASPLWPSVLQSRNLFPIRFVRNAYLRLRS